MFYNINLKFRCNKLFVDNIKHILISWTCIINFKNLLEKIDGRF